MKNPRTLTSSVLCSQLLILDSTHDSPFLSAFMIWTSVSELEEDKGRGPVNSVLYWFKGFGIALVPEVC